MALLLSPALTVVTGLMADQDGGKASSGQRAVIVIQAFADERRQGEGERHGKEKSAVGEAHAAFANITPVLRAIGVSPRPRSSAWRAHSCGLGERIGFSIPDL